MPNACDERKSKFLNINYSTATNKLRKQVLFKYVRMAGHDVCYRCGEVISNVDDFTIDHKNPWLYEDPNLFWDLDNISFSHRKCNIPHRYFTKECGNIGGFYQRKVDKDELWCNKCKKFLNICEFNDNAYTWSGKQKWCKSCAKRHQKRRDINDGNNQKMEAFV
jgi:hypothetical protein